jgi:hypothetical protein
MVIVAMTITIVSTSSGVIGGRFSGAAAPSFLASLAARARDPHDRNHDHQQQLKQGDGAQQGKEAGGPARDGLVLSRRPSAPRRRPASVDPPGLELVARRIGHAHRGRKHEELATVVGSKGRTQVHGWL